MWDMSPYPVLYPPAAAAIRIGISYYIDHMVSFAIDPRSRMPDRHATTRRSRIDRPHGAPRPADVAAVAQNDLYHHP